MPTTSPAMRTAAAAVLDRPLGRWETTTRYVHAADAARLIRATLAHRFPGTKFWVRSRNFSGGSAVDVYFDGTAKGAPSKRDVKAIVDAFGGADFDGSIDMSFSHDAYLSPDGTVTYGGTRGTEGSRGYYAAVEVAPPAGATRVHFGSYFHVDDYKPYGARS